MLKVRPVGDGAVFVDAMAMTVFYSSFVMSLLNISSFSLHSCGLFGACDMPYQMLSSVSCGILVEFFETVVLKYSSCVWKRSNSIPLSD